MVTNKMPTKYQGGASPRTEKAVATPGPSQIRQAVHGKILQYQHKGEQSSLVGQSRPGGLSASSFDRIYPRIEFWKRMEFYRTVGRVQNVVESYVLDIINREWFYDAGDNAEDTDKDNIEEFVKLMENWEEQVGVSELFSIMVRNWIVNGVNIISPVDWNFLQLQSIQAKRRDKFGKTTEYIQIMDGRDLILDADQFIEVPFINLDREPWPVGMFDSLMSNDYIDVDGRAPQPSLALYRQALQDNMKIHHKFASPRVIYTAVDANEETIDNDIAPIVEGMVPGDRAVFNTPIEISQETVDGNARFIEHVNKIVDEIDTGLQSSANRVIAEPSAMADAREAGSADDDRTLGIMEKLRVFMNKEVIPRVTGLEPGKLVLKWGAKDAFDLEFPTALKDAIDSRILRPEQAAIMLEEQYHWKIPTMDDVEEKFGIKIAEQEPEGEKPLPSTEPDIENPEETPELTTEKHKIDNEIKNEKLVTLRFLNQKIQEM
jgi:hypothetical protein